MARTKATVKMRDIGNRQPGMFGYADLALTIIELIKKWRA